MTYACTGNLRLSGWGEAGTGKWVAIIGMKSFTARPTSKTGESGFIIVNRTVLKRALLTVWPPRHRAWTLKWRLRGCAGNLLGWSKKLVQLSVTIREGEETCLGHWLTVIIPLTIPVCTHGTCKCEHTHSGTHMGTHTGTHMCSHMDTQA